MSFIPNFAPDRDLAVSLDAADPLASLRSRFCLPHRADGQPAVYLCGHSLGLQPRRARDLMLATFYRPTRERFAILIDEPTFPSDRYAVLSQLTHHEQDSANAFIGIGPRSGEMLLRVEDVEEVFARQGGRIAVALFAGVNF